MYIVLSLTNCIVLICFITFLLAQPLPASGLDNLLVPMVSKSNAIAAEANLPPPTTPNSK